MTAAALRRFGFEPLAEPAWRDAEAGPWRLRVQRGSAAHGYVSRTVVEPRRAVLCKGRTPWMSNGALERESHAWHGERARGLVVVAGLGMGLYAHAVAAKPAVERVVVAEVDPDVIAVMRAGSGFESWPHRDKVTLLQADVLAPDFAARLAAATDGRRPDYLYADIWPDYPAAEAPAQTAALVRALDPVAAGWWGQELAAAAWAHRRRLPLDAATLEAWAAATGLPPLAAEDRHATFVRAAAALVDVAALAGAARPRWLARLRQLVDIPSLRLAIGRRDR